MSPSNIITIGPRRKAPPVHRPDGFETQYDAYEPRFKQLDDLVMVIFGVEIRSGEGLAIEARLLQALKHDGGPGLLEHGQVKTGFGPHSKIWFAYWLSQEEYENWCAHSGIEDLFSDDALLDGDIGLWREYCHVSLDHNETSYSREENVTGLANFCDNIEVTPHHGYWGSARDRMVATADDDLDATGKYRSVDIQKTLGKRVQITAPKNTCLIKTTQDLSLANDAQLAIYHETVEPALHAGLNYLRANGEVSGCLGMRFMQELPSSGEAMRTIGIGYFTSLGTLENWTHHHPTHEKIMQVFTEMVGQFNGQPGLHLWHEISVFDAGRLTGDYVNCSADGTLMQSQNKI